MRLSLHLKFGLFAALFTTVSAPNTALAQLDDWDRVQHQIQSAAMNADVEALKNLSLQLEHSNLAQITWKHYWQAYIAYRLISFDQNEDQTTPHMLACKEHAEAAIEAGETSGESHALLATCLGRLAAGGMSAGMRYGTASGNAQDESILEAPDNPRVLMLAGVSDYNKPVIWGGDIDRAERRLRRAVELLEHPASKENAPWLPQWGQVDAYGHLAIVLNRLDQKDKAIALLDQAETNGLESSWLDSIGRSIANN